MPKFFSNLYINKNLLLKFLMVFAAFSVMIAINYLFGSYVMHKNMSSYGEIAEMQSMTLVAGLILALIVCAVLTYMHIKVIRSNEASKSKSAYLANMSHEIRTPMNAIIGMSEFLQHEKLNERQMDFVNDIHSSAHSLLTIINDILDMTKIESGKLSLMPVNYNFNLFLDNIKSTLMYLTEKKGIKYKFETTRDIPRYLYGDDIRLKQVLTNICSNAVKFTIRGSVCFRVVAMNEILLFQIIDTGRGISKEEMATLFNAYEKIGAKDNREFIGTGLGLNISRTYLEMMGGRILVESKLGQGTTFTVELPIVKGSDEEELTANEELEEQSLCAPNVNILLVDDNEFNIKTVEALLSLFYINVKYVSSGREAVEMVQEDDFDIVLMDHMMPEMDGIETVREIRKLGGKYNDLIIIALTANAIYGANEMFLSNGFNGYAAKPVEMKDLKRILLEWLPEEKISLSNRSYNDNSQLSFDPEFQKSLFKLFYKNNRDKYDEIIKALKIGNIPLAYRLAHTLKSNAGQIGKTALQHAAAGIEANLKHGKNHVTEKHIKTLEKEFFIALEDLSSFNEEPPRITVNNGEFLRAQIASELLDKLIIMLKNGDTESLKYIDNLRLMQCNERIKNKLIQEIEDFEFDKAYDSVIELIKTM